jgi:hypothetical protein
MRKLINLATAFVFLNALTVNVFAASIENPVSPAFSNVSNILSSFSALIVPIAVFLFLVMIIYGGFTKLTAAGDAEKEAKAMKILEAGIIGFVIIVLAPLIVSLITSFLGTKTVITSN